jgi:hypothetical protein
MHDDAKRFLVTCPECQRSGNISQRNALLLNNNVQIDLFDVWGIDFMGPFVNSNGYDHILVIIDCVSKWVKKFHVGKHLRKKPFSNYQDDDIPSIRRSYNFNK